MYGYLNRTRSSRQDRQESGQRGLSPEQLKEKIEQYQQRRAQYQQWKTDLEGGAESQISLTDPQSRSMRVGHGVEVSYKRADRGRSQAQVGGGARGDQ